MALAVAWRGAADTAAECELVAPRKVNARRGEAGFVRIFCLLELLKQTLR